MYKNGFLRRLSACAFAVLLVFLLPAARIRAYAGSASFVSQSAALSTSTIRGLLGDITAEVRGPSSSYTLTIDSTNGDDIKALLTGTRYDQIECYDLSLTAVGAQTISRNPQFGDATITIPVGSSMNPAKGTFAVYTIGTDGELEKLSCSVVYGRSTEHAVKFMTIHFSTYAIVYASGGSTRVTGSRNNRSTTSAPSGTAGSVVSGAAASTQVTAPADNNNNTNAAASASVQSDPAVGSSSQSIQGLTGMGQPEPAITPNTASSSTGATAAVSSSDASTAAATAASTTVTAADNGKDENGKGPDGSDPYSTPKTGDRRFYGVLCSAVVVVTILLILVARAGRRED